MTSTIRGPVERTTAVPTPRSAVDGRPEAAVTAAPAAPPADPGVIGLPAFIVGSLALALVNIGFTPVSALFAAVPIIMTAAAVGQLIAAVWAMRLGQGAAASFNAVFAGFWASYAVLSLGLAHNWFLIGPLGVHRTQELFLIAWIAVVGLMTVATARLPLLFTALLALVESSFVLSYLALANLNANLTKISGWVIVAFCAIGGYLFLSAMNVANGGKPYPMGRPLVR